jgi:hypothetical protein
MGRIAGNDAPASDVENGDLSGVLEPGGRRAVLYDVTDGMVAATIRNESPRQ